VADPARKSSDRTITLRLTRVLRCRWYHRAGPEGL